MCTSNLVCINEAEGEVLFGTTDHIFLKHSNNNFRLVTAPDTTSCMHGIYTTVASSQQLVLISLDSAS